MDEATKVEESDETSTDSDDSVAKTSIVGPKEQLASISQPIDRSPNVELQQKTSAPSYLFSLKDNDTPPFRKPVREPQPKLLIDSILSAADAIDMVTAGVEEDGLPKLLIERNVIFKYDIAERNFLISLLSETISYAARHDFNEFKLACLISIYINTHLCFKRYYWLPPVDVWCYFKEILIRHTIEDSPDGQEVFEPTEAYDILTHFHTIYMNNLPLIHIIVFGAHRIKFTWPFNK